MTAILGGTISGTSTYSLLKEGYGTLVLSNVTNATSFNSGASRFYVINNGTLEIQGTTGTALEALGTSPASTVADNIFLSGGV
jgi:hypothetical protein